METFADRAIPYYLRQTEPDHLPPGVSALNPYRQPEVQSIVNQFYTRFFNDNNRRVYILGINPGRFGAGVSGISFTTPQNLQRYCGIENNLPPTPELSSRFIYQIVEAFGGAEAFYGRFFLTSLYPLALVKNGKNYNFYDDKATTAALWPDIISSVRQQLTFGCDRNIAVCLGRKNEAFFQKLNQQHGFFSRIVTLDHPRYILQYRSRDVDAYVDKYVTTLGECIAL
ncbi:uracil-DNA glycosylase family protein [Larkinella rosea]|uniref:SMUG2 DNA glycosylase family protein n=1 Tax=Larkinella rosea TaxID=2025312 RepID=A0A3P1BP72_9BACT|nr:uracil-DNA glycosylase family protein [Larkinella rosea]RRB02626.1 SMUG2 DNA glycosylase family protein [Larkinella rosea]